MHDFEMGANLINFQNNEMREERNFLCQFQHFMNETNL